MKREEVKDLNSAIHLSAEERERLNTVRSATEGRGLLAPDAQERAQHLWNEAKGMFMKAELQGANVAVNDLIKLGNTTRLPDAYHLAALLTATEAASLV